MFFEYYNLAIYHTNTKNLCRNSVLWFFKSARYLENIWIHAGVSNFLIYD